jgi:hypothetical protein
VRKTSISSYAVSAVEGPKLKNLKKLEKKTLGENQEKQIS